MLQLRGWEGAHRHGPRLVGAWGLEPTTPLPSAQSWPAGLDVEERTWEPGLQDMGIMLCCMRQCRTDD